MMEAKFRTDKLQNGNCDTTDNFVSPNTADFKTQTSHTVRFKNTATPQAEILFTSKEPISKTSIFCMFWYKRCCNWLGAMKGMALWSRGFSRGSLFRTWPKPETAHEKSLAPRVPLNPTAQATVDNPLAESVLFHPSCAWSSIYSSFVLLLVLIPV